MLRKLLFVYDEDEYIVNVIKKTLLIKRSKTFTREFYFLDAIYAGEDWIVTEATLSKNDEMILDFENIKIDFKYAKEK